MLNDKELYALTKPILSTIRELEWELVKNIGARLQVNDEVGGSAYWQIQRLEELGGLHEDNLKLLAQYSGKTIEQIKRMIEQAGLLAVDYPSLNEAFKRGLSDVDPRVVGLSPVLEAFIGPLQDEGRLLITKAITESNVQYQAIVDRIALETGQGIKSYSQAVTDSLVELAEKGISTTRYAGINKNGVPYVINYPLEASVRRSVMTAINQVANTTNHKLVEEMKPEYIAVSAHLGARDKGDGYENHESWQGRVYKNDGSFERLTGYNSGDMLGLGGYNCRHIHYPYYKGLSPEPEQVNTEENRKRYELEQRQRALERRVRESKKRIELIKTSGGNIKREQALLKSRQAKLREFVENNGLVRQHERERIA